MAHSERFEELAAARALDLPLGDPHQPGRVSVVEKAERVGIPQLDSRDERPIVLLRVICHFLRCLATRISKRLRAERLSWFYR